MRKMIDVLHFPKHQVSNVVFISLNVTSVFLVLLAVVNTTIWFTNVPSIPGTMNFMVTTTGLSIFVGYVLAALIAASFAQMLRYSACLVETVTQLDNIPQSKEFSNIKS